MRSDQTFSATREKLSPFDIEPRIAEILRDKIPRRLLGPYQPRTEPQVVEALGRLIGPADGQVRDVRRMSGGASKEQFVFTLDGGAGPRALVLRMDPLEGIIETCRYREAEVMQALAGTVPVPEVVYVDAEGEKLGQPAMVTEFVQGVAKPPDAVSGVSGLGTRFSDEWITRLAPQFVDNLVKIHNFDFRSAHLPHFDIPSEHPYQAALWQVNWWAQVWRQDRVDAFPLIALVESWLRENLPVCDDLVLLHGDFRTGNYLFDPEGGEISAILDWELAHIGDFHEDIAWNFQPVFGQRLDDGQKLYSSLFRREELIAAYEKVSGRTVNPDTLLFYDVLNGWKGAIIDLTACLTAPRDGNNHQDILLSWLASSAHIHLSHIASLIE